MHGFCTDFARFQNVQKVLFVAKSDKGCRNYRVKNHVALIKNYDDSKLPWIEANRRLALLAFTSAKTPLTIWCATVNMPPTSNGDIVLYRSDQIVLFYGSNSWAYTRLGKMNLSENEVVSLLSNGDVSIRLTLWFSRTTSSSLLRLPVAGFGVRPRLRSDGFCRVNQRQNKTILLELKSTWLFYWGDVRFMLLHLPAASSNFLHL